MTFNINYNPGHEYFFTITYTSGSWWMAVNDNNIPGGVTYVYQEESPLPGVNPGTHLIDHINTSIWVEVISNDPNWDTYFSSTTFVAKDAKIYINGFGQYWSPASNQHKHTVDNRNSAIYPFPPGSAMTGTLINGGTLTFHLQNLVYDAC